MRHTFGWSLPPGVTQRMIDEAYGEEYPCANCGHSSENHLGEDDIQDPDGYRPILLELVEAGPPLQTGTRLWKAYCAAVKALALCQIKDCECRSLLGPEDPRLDGDMPDD